MCPIPPLLTLPDDPTMPRYTAESTPVDIPDHSDRVARSSQVALSKTSQLLKDLCSTMEKGLPDILDELKVATLGHYESLSTGIQVRANVEVLSKGIREVRIGLTKKRCLARSVSSKEDFTKMIHQLDSTLENVNNIYRHFMSVLTLDQVKLDTAMMNLKDLQNFMEKLKSRPESPNLSLRWYGPACSSTYPVLNLDTIHEEPEVSEDPIVTKRRKTDVFPHVLVNQPRGDWTGKWLDNPSNSEWKKLSDMVLNCSYQSDGDETDDYSGDDDLSLSGSCN